MELTGLTKEQVDLLDQMWEISDLDSLSEWQNGLPREQQKMSQTLQYLVTIEYLDSMDVDSEDPCHIQSQEIINRFRLNRN